ncbi:metallophosphoesterase [Wenxinia marina]|uniref:Putative phosphohydrolase n=1 Tax=Wenxinia marina DSM 24838 TaxID=1123501 RepID=A0A0D0QD75_9RHOB|nr:metallophosphoesterase [Wenxinia marina]KIQ70262.1 putative phosphohydrolase [Wenxinia marina DSM 24838]GGL49955.1 hypothetical protein GCM10011392_00280 [Wenxinia marina]
MLIAHLSDLHLSAGPPETAPVRPDVAWIVPLVVADILSLPRLPDVVVVTGDVADGGSDADYALVREVLSPLPVPVLVVPGNHDRRRPMRAAFPQGWAHPEFLLSETVIGRTRFIGLDSQLPGRVEGSLCRERLDWLEERLADPTPAVVLLHHPPFPSGNRDWDATALIEGRGRLEAILRAAPGPLRLLCGHVHQCYHTVWAGRYAAVGGSPAFQYALDFEPEGEPPLTDGPVIYSLHHLHSDGVAVHPRAVPVPPRPDL